MGANLNTPVLLIGFNRPHLIVHPFEAIRAARPRQLFFAVDGPRSHVPGEAERVEAVRAVSSRVDWDCELQTRFRDRNMGCGKGVADAITWFFNNVEEGIILEDDLIPDPSFFPFCQELLARYRTDERVTLICGYNFLGVGGPAVPGSYVFTRYISSWGWASWRRLWQHYDFEMRAWPKAKADGMLNGLFTSRKEFRQYSGQFDEAYAGAGAHTWDTQWGFTCWLLGGVTAMPAGNLMRNIGFGADATHTPHRFDCGSTSVTAMRFPLRHPPDVTLDRRYERLLFRAQHKPLALVVLRRLQELGPIWVLRRSVQVIIKGGF